MCPLAVVPDTVPLAHVRFLSFLFSIGWFVFPDAASASSRALRAQCSWRGEAPSVVFAALHLARRPTVFLRSCKIRRTVPCCVTRGSANILAPHRSRALCNYDMQWPTTSALEHVRRTPWRPAGDLVTVKLPDNQQMRTCTPCAPQAFVHAWPWFGMAAEMMAILSEEGSALPLPPMVPA